MQKEEAEICFEMSLEDRETESEFRRRFHDFRDPDWPKDEFEAAADEPDPSELLPVPDPD